MRRFPQLSLLLMASLCLLRGGLGHAQTAPPLPRPSSVEQLHTPGVLTEIGVLAGANYRIDIPDGWNHSLVVYYHGYAQQPVSFHLAEQVHQQARPMLDRKYAVIQSAYSLPGWALPQAYPETEFLRRYFVKKFGPVHETYVTGESMGGALVMVTIELNPRPYMGGLDLCGAVGPTFESFDRRFAMRAAFDHYFPGVMGPLVPVPADYEATTAVRAKILAALDKNPTAAHEMRSLMGLRTDANVAYDIAYFTFVIGDMQRRAGGNPFDNRNWLYNGTDLDNSRSDFDLNDGVHRYAAVSRARDYLMHHYSPSGRLSKPMLAVHTLYDPVVPPGSLELYDHMVQMAGYGDNLVQQYVKREGHCNITQDEIGNAFDQLVNWVHHGPRPQAGLLREAPGKDREQPAVPPTRTNQQPLVPKPGASPLRTSPNTD